MLQDNQMLSEAWIAKGSRVNLQFESMKIFVQKQDDNSVINLDVNYIDKITKVKQNICTKTGILISQQQLKCGDQTLDDNKQLLEYKIQPDTEFTLVQASASPSTPEPEPEPEPDDPSTNQSRETSKETKTNQTIREVVA